MEQVRGSFLSGSQVTLYPSVMDINEDGWKKMKSSGWDIESSIKETELT